VRVDAWTKEDEAILIKHYVTHSARWVAHELTRSGRPPRSVGAIKMRAAKLGLVKQVHAPPRNRGPVPLADLHSQSLFSVLSGFVVCVRDLVFTIADRNTAGELDRIAGGIDRTLAELRNRLSSPRASGDGVTARRRVS